MASGGGLPRQGSQISINVSIINAWMSGKETPRLPKIQTDTNGRGLDPDDEKEHTPAYKRSKNMTTDYARQGDQELNQRSFSRRYFDPPTRLNPLSFVRNSVDDDATSVMDTSEKLEVFEKFRTNLAHKPQKQGLPQLPIFDKRLQMLDVIEANSVVIIQGATGCGKTTQLPQYILEECANERRHCNIIVTQPRRIAAISVATRVARERDVPVGSIIGYQVGLENKSSDDTRLLYCTTGVLLEKLIRRKNLDEYTHVIIDEVHERDQNTDLALLIARVLQQRFSQQTKVILMSATFDPDIAKHFQVHLGNGNLVDPPILTVGNQVHTLTIKYLDNLIDAMKRFGFESDSFNFSRTDPDLQPDLYKVTLNLIDIFQEFDCQDEWNKNLKNNRDFRRGSVLVFLPGIHEIEALHAVLMKEATQKRWQILPLHSTITNDEQRRVFEIAETGYRKVILSTNIAESSITVPDIRYVIDFCLTRQNVCDPETNCPSLQLEWASKANCTQRAGRAGRVQRGIVYRMVSKSFFDNLSDFSEPEMQRSPLDQVILKVKKLDLADPIAFLSEAISPPLKSNILRTILTLKEIGAMSINYKSGHSLKLEPSDHNGNLTFLGRIISQLPLEPQLGKLIALGHVFGCLKDCVIMAAAMNVQSMFSRPYMKPIPCYQSKLIWADNKFSDPLALLNAYKHWHSLKERRFFSRPGSTEDEPSWCRKMFVEQTRLRDVDKLVLELLNRLEKIGIKSDVSLGVENMATYDVLLRMIICGAFYPNYFTCDPLDEVEVAKTLNGYNPLNTVCIGGLPHEEEAELYEGDIKSQLAKLHCASVNKISISFRNTKGYIQFVQDTIQLRDTVDNKSLVKINNVSPSVYMALMIPRVFRRGNNSNQLQIELFSKSVVEQLVDGRRRLRESHLSLDGMLDRSLSVRSGDESKCIKVSYAKLPSMLDITKLLNPHISTKCGEFYATYNDSRCVEQMGHLEHVTIPLAAKNGRPMRSPSELVEGKYCLAPYQDAYYRARIESVDNPLASVFFVDYGNRAEVPIEHLIEFDHMNFPDLLDIPFMALKFEMCGVKPSPSRYPDGRYDQEADTFFNVLLFNRGFVNAEIYSVVHSDVIRVDLFSAKEPRIKASELLIKKGFSIAVKESWLSEQNHERRVAARNNPDRNQTKFFEEPLQGAQENTVLDDSQHKRIKRTGGTRYLQGPHSPLEVTLRGMSQSIGGKEIRIDRDSVNCILLDPEPQAKFDKLVVSSLATVSPNSRNKMSLRNTTVMPAVRGLPALMCLIFAPQIELRTDKQREKFTGAIFGLGTHQEEGDDRWHALYEDHDIELQFDITITVEMMAKVNKIRHQMNQLLTSDEHNEVLLVTSAREVASKQKNLRDDIASLVMKDYAPDAGKLNFQPTFEWGIAEDILIPMSNNRDLRGDKDVFPLHCCPALVEKLTPNALKLQKHLGELKRQSSTASGNRLPGGAICEVCTVTSYSTLALRDHLESHQHIEKVDRLYRRLQTS